jgi:hypothetical protein
MQEIVQIIKEARLKNGESVKGSRYIYAVAAPKSQEQKFWFTIGSGGEQKLK